MSNLIEMLESSITRSILQTTEFGFLTTTRSKTTQWMGGLENLANKDKHGIMSDSDYGDCVFAQTNTTPDTDTKLEHWYAKKLTADRFGVKLTKPFDKIKTRQIAHSKKLLGELHPKYSIARLRFIAPDFDDVSTWSLNSNLYNETSIQAAIEFATNTPWYYLTEHEQILYTKYPATKAGNNQLYVYCDNGMVQNNGDANYGVWCPRLLIDIKHPIIKQISVALNETWENGIWKSTNLSEISIHSTNTKQIPDIESWLDKYAKSGFGFFDGKFLMNPAEEFHFLLEFGK